jgi:polar amino acid transport system substrate-binding protein
MIRTGFFPSLLLAALLTTLSLTAIAQTEKSVVVDNSLTLVVDNYPPYIDELLPGQGLLTELVVAAFQSQGISTKLQFKPWQHIRKAATAPQHASFLWFKDKELEQDWLFSEPVVQLRQVLISQASQSLQPERLDQLRPYRLGVTQGYYYGPQFEALKPELRLTTAVSDYQTLLLLVQGTVDFILMDPIVAHQLSQSFTQQTLNLRLLSKPVLTAKPAYLVCSRNYLPCHGIIQQFNRGLALQQQNGLQRRLFGVGVTLFP